MRTSGARPLSGGDCVMKQRGRCRGNGYVSGRWLLGNNARLPAALLTWPTVFPVSEVLSAARSPDRFSQTDQPSRPPRLQVLPAMPVAADRLSLPAQSQRSSSTDSTPDMPVALVDEEPSHLGRASTPALPMRVWISATSSYSMDSNSTVIWTCHPRNPTQGSHLPFQTWTALLPIRGMRFVWLVCEYIRRIRSSVWRWHIRCRRTMSKRLWIVTILPCPRRLRRASGICVSRNNAGCVLE